MVANHHPDHPLMSHREVHNRWLRPMIVGIVLVRVLAFAIGVRHLRDVMCLALPTLARMSAAVILLVMIFVRLERCTSHRAHWLRDIGSVQPVTSNPQNPRGPR